MTSVTIGSAEPHVEDPELVGRRWRTGVLLLILADASFLVALVFAYFYLRGLNTSKAWLAPHQHTAVIWVGWVIAAGAIASALAFHWGVKGIRAGSEPRLVSGMSLALVVVLADAVVQVIQLVTFPFGVGTSAYSSSAYTLAGANLFHLLITGFLGFAMVNRARLHLYSETSHWQVRLVLTWWTWVAFASVVGAFTVSFIASPNR